MKIADISRVERDERDALKGFQRPEIQQHVKEIVEYLDQGNVRFPNSQILANALDVRITASSGTRPANHEGVGQTGTLTNPIAQVANRVAWIEEGQRQQLHCHARRINHFTSRWKRSYQTTSKYNASSLS
ncbi:hypothetical protein [Massilia phosphatilytica]